MCIRDRAYMYTMLREAARRNRPFTRTDLVEKGRSIVLFPGVEDWFRRINDFGAGQGVQVEHYIISSGLRAVSYTHLGCRRWYRSWSSTPTTAPPCTSSATCSATKSCLLYTSRCV